MGRTRDTLKRRARKTVKWGGLVVTVLLLVVWIGSGWYARLWRIGGERFVGVATGQVVFVDQADSDMRFESDVLDLSTTAFHLDWRFSWALSTPFAGAALPLWFPALLSLLATAAAWRADAKYLRRVREGLCPACGYDRAGLAAVSVCPECGAAPRV